MRTVFTLATVIAIGASACSPPLAESRRSALSQEGIRREIGPEGGELRGEPGTPLAGFVLSIPSGALAAPTLFTVRLATPPSGLPGLAVAIGPRYVIEPAMTLRKAAHATLPIYPGTYSHYDGRSQQAVAFGFDGRNFVEHEASADELGVELDFDVIDSLIPTFNLRPIEPVCLKKRTCLQACNRGGFCVLPIAQAGLAGSIESVVDDNALYWVHTSLESRAVRVDLATGATTVSPPAPFDAVLRSPIAVSNNVVFAVGSLGNAVFDLSSGTQSLIDTDLAFAGYGITAIKLLGGNVVRSFFDFNELPQLDDSWIRSTVGTFKTKALLPQQLRTMVPHFGDSSRFYSLSVGRLGIDVTAQLNPLLTEIDVEGEVHAVERLTEFFIIPRMSGRAIRAGGVVVGTEVAFSKNRRQLTICRFVGNDHSCNENAITSDEDDVGLGQFALDPGGGIWLTGSGIGEVVFVPDTQSPSFARHALTEDFPGEDIGGVVGIHAIAPRQSVVLLSSGRVLFVQFQD